MVSSMTYQASARKPLFLDPRGFLGHAKKIMDHTFPESKLNDVSEFIRVA